MQSHSRNTCVSSAGSGCGYGCSDKVTHSVFVCMCAMFHNLNVHSNVVNFEGAVLILQFLFVAL